MTVELEDRVRRALAHRAEATTVGRASADTVQRGSDAVVVDLAASRRRLGARDRRRPMLAVAAVALVAIGGIALSRRTEPPTEQDATPATQPATSAPSAPSSVVHRGLTLDDRRVLPVESELPADRYVVDTTRLPEGWTATERLSSTLDFTHGGIGYGYSAQITTADGVTVSIWATRGLGAQLPEGEPIGTIDGVPAYASTDGSTSVNWQPDPRVVVTIQGDRPVGELVDLADTLRYRRVAELPILPADPVGPPTNEAHVRFSGTLSGQPWTAEVDPGPLRTMWVSFDGARAGGFEADRQSQPTDVAVTGLERTTIAVAGTGLVVIGHGAPSLTSVVATLADGSTASFPTYQRELEAFFAVPIPVGARVTTLTFLAGDVVRATLEVPAWPADLDGTYGGYPLS